MSTETVIVLLFAALSAVIAGMMFQKGYFHEESNTWWRRTIDPDRLFSLHLKNREVITAADQLAFLICITTAVFILACGILTVLGLVDSVRAMKLAPSILVAGVFLSWILRYGFLYLYKNTPPQELPRVWPFKKH